MRTITLLPCFLLCAGCAALQAPGEVAYQTLHAVDTTQTLEIALRPRQYCERESAWEIGRHPSVAGVAAWAVTDALGHAAATEWLIDHGHPRLVWVWEALTIADTGHAVAANFTIGLK